jgi:hypothetical protein
MAKFFLSKVRMRFNLDELRHDFPFGLQSFDIFSFKIRDADRFGFSFFICLFQLAISGKPVAGRLMDIKKIYIIYPNPFECFVNSVVVFIFTWSEFG